MATPKAAFPTVLKRGDGDSPEVFTEIARVTSFPPPELSRAMKDITPYGVDSWRERLPTLRDIGEFTIRVTYDSTDATHQALVDAWMDSTYDNYQIAFSDAGAETWTFGSYISKLKPVTELEGEVAMDVTFSPSKAPTIA